MSYIGNPSTQQSYIPAVDYFSGNGSTVAFTLSRPVATTLDVVVTIENVDQNPGTAYTVNGTTITFTSAPPTGTNNIYVRYTTLNVVNYTNRGAATGGGNDQVFYVNSQTVTNSYTIPSGQSAMSTGPITMGPGVNVTIAPGSKWVIL